MSRAAGTPLRRNRDFQLLWTGQGISALGSQLSQVAYPLLVLGLGDSAAAAGAVGCARWVPVVALALPAGLLADRLDRRRLLIAASCAGAAAMLIVPIGLAIGFLPVWLIAAVALVDGSVFVLNNTGERGLVRRVVAPGELRDAIARNESRMFGANLAGPPLGGALFEIARFLPFAGDGCSYLIAAATLARVRPDAGHVRDPPAPRELLEGLRWLWRVPLFRFATLLFAGSNPIFTGLYLLVVVLARSGGASPGLVGVMLAIAAGGGLGGALIAPLVIHRVTPRRIVIAECWVLAGALPLMLVTHNAAALGLILGAAEFLTPITNIVLVSRRVELAPDQLQGRVQAGATQVTLSGAWAGPLFVGLLLSAAGANVTVLALTGWALALALCASVTRSLRDVEIKPPWST